MATIEVFGDRRFVATMRAAGVDVKQLKDAHRAAASIAAGAAATAAPKRTGRLAGTVRVGATQRAGIVRAGRKSVPYANPIHWGWPARGIKANPWMSRAAQASEPAWLRVYMDHVEDIIDRVEGI